MESLINQTFLTFEKKESPEELPKLVETNKKALLELNRSK